MDVVFYHGPHCADGVASRWVAHKKWPSAQFIPFGTNEVMTARHKSVCVGKNVLFVDVAPGLADVAWLHTNCTLTIYDHHYSTLQRLKYSGYLSQINTVLCQHMCGCHIIWTQCFPGKPLPWVLKYIESRDLWRFQNKNEQIISWIISTNLLNKPVEQTYDYLDSLVSSKGWLWNPSHSDRWGQYQAKLNQILHQNVESAMLTTPNHMLVHVLVIRTRYLWMASDMMEILSKKHSGALFMFVHTQDKTSVVTLRGTAALAVAQQWTSGGGHLMAAGFRTTQRDLKQRLVTTGG